jgi:DNA-binding NtrC family response regulator
MEPITIRVLFVERNPENATLVRLMLGPLGSNRFHMRQARDLQSASEYLQKESADVILLGLELPDSDLLDTLRAAIDIAKSIPIIAILGSDIAPTTLTAIHAGVGDYLFRVRLNQADLTASIVQQTNRVRRIQQAPAISVDRDPIRVLVVEDNPGDVALIRHTLRSAKTTDFRISHARSLSSALESLHRELDVVLLDLNLPDCHDLETLHRLKAHNPHLPIIVVTGLEDRLKAVEALTIGAWDYLVKGQVDGHLLEKAILRCVEHRHGLSQHHRHSPKRTRSTHH